MSSEIRRALVLHQQSRVLTQQELQLLSNLPHFSGVRAGLFPQVGLKHQVVNNQLVHCPHHPQKHVLLRVVGHRHCQNHQALPFKRTLLDSPHHSPPLHTAEHSDPYVRVRTLSQHDSQLHCHFSLPNTHPTHAELVFASSSHATSASLCLSVGLHFRLLPHLDNLAHFLRSQELISRLLDIEKLRGGSHSTQIPRGLLPLTHVAEDHSLPTQLHKPLSKGHHFIGLAGRMPRVQFRIGFYLPKQRVVAVAQQETVLSEESGFFQHHQQFLQ